MNDILFEAVKAAIVIVMMVGIRYFIPWIKTAIGTSKYKWIVSMISAAVQAAEQMITAEKSGAEKKAIVTKFIKEQLTAHNISISDDQLNTLIEAAVYALNQAKKVGE